MIEVEKKGIGKAKVGLLIPVILVVILAVSNVWSYTTLSNEKDNLQNHVNTFQSQINSLNTTHQDYVSTHNHSNSEYVALQSQVSMLKDENPIPQAQIAGMNETLTLFERQTREVFYFRIFSLYNYKT